MDLRDEQRVILKPLIPVKENRPDGCITTGRWVVIVSVFRGPTMCAN